MRFKVHTNITNLKIRLSFLISIFYFAFSFSQDTVSPTVVITQSTTDTDVFEDQVVRITGTFSENMSSSPQITIGNLITNANMTGSGSSWHYDWDVSTGNPSTGSVSVTITGTDSAGNSLGSTTPFTKAYNPNGSNRNAIQNTTMYLNNHTNWLTGNSDALY